jgi:hypothetical protein
MSAKARYAASSQRQLAAIYLEERRTHVGILDDAEFRGLEGGRGLDALLDRTGGDQQKKDRQGLPATSFSVVWLRA